MKKPKEKALSSSVSFYAGIRNSKHQFLYVRGKARNYESSPEGVSILIEREYAEVFEIDIKEDKQNPFTVFDKYGYADATEIIKKDFTVEQLVKFYYELYLKSKLKGENL